MQPRQYIIIKWCIYSAFTLLLFLLQGCVLQYIRVRGVMPFLYPMLAGTIAIYEGRTGGAFFAVGLGALCDISRLGPAPGFFTIVFAVSALLIALLVEYLLPPSFLCALASVSITFFLTDMGRLLFYQSRGAAVEALLEVAVIEYLLTLPLLPLVHRWYRRLHRRLSEEY